MQEGLRGEHNLKEVSRNLSIRVPVTEGTYLQSSKPFSAYRSLRLKPSKIQLINWDETIKWNTQEDVRLKK